MVIADFPAFVKKRKLSRILMWGWRDSIAEGLEDLGKIPLTHMGWELTAVFNSVPGYLSPHGSLRHMRVLYTC